MVYVKICGITHLEDAQAAVACGADAIGFVFAPESPRFIAPQEVGRIVAALPPFVTTVGVVTSGAAEALRRILDLSGINLLQFHGAFPASVVHPFAERAIFAVRVQDESSLLDIPPFPVRALLLDTCHEQHLGGSGMTFDWEIAAAAHPFGRIILAGGLTPENVDAACKKVRPYGVDVSSGVESEKRKKDHDKIARFVRAAKCAIPEPVAPAPLKETVGDG